MNIDQIYKMVSMRGRGCTYQQIADDVRLSVMTVGKFFRVPKPLPAPAPAWVYRDARLLAAFGRSAADIAQLTGLTVAEAEKCAAGVRVVAQYKPPAPDPLPDRICELLRAGHSRRAVARHLGVTLATVQKHGKGVGPAPLN